MKCNQNEWSNQNNSQNHSTQLICKVQTFDSRKIVLGQLKTVSIRHKIYILFFLSPHILLIRMSMRPNSFSVSSIAAMMVSVCLTSMHKGRQRRPDTAHSFCAALGKAFRIWEATTLALSYHLMKNRRIVGTIRRNNLFELVQVSAGNHCVTAMPAVGERERERIEQNITMWTEKETTRKSTWCAVLIRPRKYNHSFNEYREAKGVKQTEKNRSRYHNFKNVTI